MAYGPTGGLGLWGWTSPAPHWNWSIEDSLCWHAHAVCGGVARDWEELTQYIASCNNIGIGVGQFDHTRIGLKSWIVLYNLVHLPQIITCYLMLDINSNAIVAVLAVTVVTQGQAITRFSRQTYMTYGIFIFLVDFISRYSTSRTFIIVPEGILRLISIVNVPTSNASGDWYDTGPPGGSRRTSMTLCNTHTKQMWTVYITLKSWRAWLWTWPTKLSLGSRWTWISSISRWT